MATVVINPRDYADVRMFCRDILDIETRIMFLRAGLMAVLWGALVLVDKQQPVGDVMFLGEIFDEDDVLQVSAAAIQMIKIVRKEGSA